MAGAEALPLLAVDAPETLADELDVDEEDLPESPEPLVAEDDDDEVLLGDAGSELPPERESVR